MSTMASLTTGVSIAFSAVCSGADQRKHQSSALLAFVNSPVTNEFPVQMRKMFPFDDVLMNFYRMGKILNIL